MTFATKCDADAWLSMRRAEIEEHRWRPPTPNRLGPRHYGSTPNLDPEPLHPDGQPPKPRTMDLFHALLGKRIYPELGDIRLADTIANDRPGSIAVLRTQLALSGLCGRLGNLISIKPVAHHDASLPEPGGDQYCNAAPFTRRFGTIATLCRARVAAT